MGQPRFSEFRKALGSFARSGERSSLDRALGYYARSASGGGAVATRRFASAFSSGGSVFGALALGTPIGSAPGRQIILANLTGRPVDEAIDTIVSALDLEGGDTDKIRTAMTRALSEALQGEDVFDPQALSEDLVVRWLVSYLSEVVFLQIVDDGGKAWFKADTPQAELFAERELRSVVRVVVDQSVNELLQGQLRNLKQSEFLLLQQDAVRRTWQEWEALR